MQLAFSPAIRSDHPSFPHGPMGPAARGSGAEATGYSYDAQQNAEFTIVTAEGDRVTISATHSLSIDAATYDSRGRMRSASGAFFERTESSRVSIQVEGDLSPEEIEDIARVVRDMAEAERALEKGHEAQALQPLARADLDMLSSVQAEFTATARVEVARLAVTAAPSPPPRAVPPPGETPAPQPSAMPDWSNTTVATAE